MSNTRFRPDDLQLSGNGKSWIGFQKVGIVDWEDRADQFDWADVYLVATLKQEDSQYPIEMKLAGSYDRETNGNIKTCTLLKRLYWLFDTIGFDGGPDIGGTMVDADGEEINLVNHFNQNHVTNPLDPKLEYIAYIYKEKGYKDPSKLYNAVFPKLVPNTPKGLKDIEGYIAFMKSKNLIKEVIEQPTPIIGVNATTTEGTASF